MRGLLIGLVAMLVVGCAAAPVRKAPDAVKQVSPLSEIVILQCGKFLGAVIVLPDGTLDATQNEDAAKAVLGSLTDGKVGIVETGQLCGPSQTT